MSQVMVVNKTSKVNCLNLKSELFVLDFRKLLEASMDQLHRRFTVEQVKALLCAYCVGTMSRLEVQEILDIGKTRFFALLKDYRQDASVFSIDYHRPTPARLSTKVEAALERELYREQELVEDKRLPISSYNYAAVHIS